MKGPTLKAFRFTQVYLENWRNFTQAEVDLQRRAFLVGPNASGKSNLLDVFRFLYDIVSVGGGFQEAVRKRGGVSRLRCLAARRYPEIAIQVRIGTDEMASAWGSTRFASRRIIGNGRSSKRKGSQRKGATFWFAQTIMIKGTRSV